MALFAIGVFLSSPLHQERLTSITDIQYLHVLTGSVPGVGMGRGKSSPSSLTTGRRQQPRQTWRSCDFRGEKRLQRALGRGVRPKHFSKDHRPWASSSCTQQDWAHVSGPSVHLESSRRQGWGGTCQEAQKSEVGWLPESWGCPLISGCVASSPDEASAMAGAHSRASCSPNGQE